MATRSIGDIKKSNGQTSLEDSISPLAAHADVRKGGSADKNELNELGRKIFLDRYAMKDMRKRTLSVGDTVIVIVDEKTGQREIGVVRAFDPGAGGVAGRVAVELNDGTVVERLTEHVSKPIETDPVQMMERVARGIAAVEGEQADQWYEKFRWLLEGWKFVPAGRILTAAGTDQQLTFYNCMPPEQEILTADGYKPIAEVSVGDLVVTHRNRLRRVLHKFERETEEPLFIIKAQKLGYDDLRVTGEHKVLAIRSEWVNTHRSRDGLRLQQEPQWIPARELKPGDFVAAPYHGKEKPVSAICISGYAEYDELWWIEIEEIMTVDYKGRVLDIEVDEDHSFVSAGLVVSNCYVIPSPKDSRRGIVETLSQMMEIMSRGGGVGINVSSLRPRHSYVKGVNGRSSGSVSWGALYSFVTGLIEQGGSRRGALMIILNCWHPDVLEFINSKREMGKITNANISVGITDKFMDAVHEDADWDLVFPDTSDPDYEMMWDGNLDKWIAAGKQIVVHKTVKARHIWDSIIESAWASAEPGVYFIERANKMSNSWYYDAGYLGCTNPCLTGDTLVSTPEGWKRVDSIVEGDRIATVLGSGIVETVEVHARVPVFKVTLSDGATLRATAAHQFHAICHEDRVRGIRKFIPTRLDALRVGDYIRIAPVLMPNRDVPNKPEGLLDREYGFLLGVLLGDGCYTPKMLSQNKVEISCDARESGWAQIVEGIMRRGGATTITRKQGRGPQRELTNSLSLTDSSSGGLARLVKECLLEPSYSHEKDIPLVYINTNAEFLAGLLDGLWSTDGNVNLTSSQPLLRLKTASEKMAQSVRRILLMFGIHGRIVRAERGEHSIYGRVIRNDRPVYEVIIGGAGVKTFAERISITHPDKADKLKQAQIDFALTGNTWVAQIEAIEPAGSEPVYDLYEPVSDTWITDGVVNKGCGEQPLPGYGVCNLGAINLSKFVVDGDVAWDDLGKAVRYAVRFLDDVIDATPYFFEENYAQQRSERRVGLNTMGLAEMLIRLGIRYGSEESVQFIDRLYNFIARQAYLSSTDIAAEKGPFPMFDAEKYLESGYMQSMPEDVHEAVREKGARNVTLLTQAPNGTIGTMVGTSTGIEPFYFWNYFRKSRLGKHEERVKVLEEWQQAHPGEPLPDYFVTAMDLAPEEHVKVQAVIQRWVDSSISKTCNLPNSYTINQTREIYELLYRLGCKGGTIYRDGSRDVQVLNLKEEDKKVSEAKASNEPRPSEAGGATAIESPAAAVNDSSSTELVRGEGGLQPKVRPRPYKRRGYTVSKATPSGTAHITMNEDEENQPFEVFVEIGKAGSDIKAMAEAMGRLMSLVLRMASPVSPVERVREIVKQITGIGGARSYGFGKRRVLSLPDAVGQALAENYLGVTYGDEGDTQGAEMGVDAAPSVGSPKQKTSAISATSADLCPNCGDSTFVRVEGCQTCYACGYSEC